MRDNKPEVLFVLGSRSWDCWIPPFLVDDTFRSSYTYFDAEDPGSIEDFARKASGTSADVVVLMSHHRTLIRDAQVGRILKQSLDSRIVCHPFDLAALAHDKRRMSNIVAQAGVVSIIPEFMIEQAIAHLSVGGDVIRKLNDGTEGQKFAVFSRPQDLLEDYGGLFLRREVLLQPFIEGEEYSVVAAVGPWGTQVYEPVFKQSSSTSGVHPCKRVRAVPRAPGEEAIATRLVAIVEELCGRFPQANGLLEFEFIRNREELFFLELNPRLAATTRMVAMASTRNPFCEVAGLRRRLGHEAVRVPTRKYAVEIPCGSMPADVQEQIARVGDVSISSRITLAHESRQGAAAGLDKINTILAEAYAAEKTAPAAEAVREPVPVLLDQDLNYPSDDYQALLLMHSAEGFEIQACTAVAGNTWMEETYFNLKETLRAMCANHIPVYKGPIHTAILKNRSMALRMLEQRVVPFAGAHAKSLGPRVSEEKLLQMHNASMSAWEAICAYGERFGARLQILATGPLTNIAQGLRRDALLANKIGRVVFMGGHFGEKSRLDRADFNVWFDAQAAAEVFASRLPITVVPLEVCRSARSTQRLYKHVLQVGRKGLARLFSEDFRLLSEQHGLQMTLSDQLAALVLIDDSLILEAKTGRVSVDTSDSPSHGKTRFHGDSQGTVRLVTRVDEQRAHMLLLSLVERMNWLHIDETAADTSKRLLDMTPPSTQATTVAAPGVRQRG
jgi:inosine-uridine nucleoside N-ribohydrolase